MEKIIAPSEMPLNHDGSVYHINLLPEDIADTIFLVGDPERVERVSSFFDHIEIKKQKREFITHTGTYQGKRASVLSTGIGTDNIDIVLNELDALVNIDLAQRTIKTEKKSLTLIRLGTSGSVNPQIDAGSIVKTNYTAGFDGLMRFYPDHTETEFHAQICNRLPYPGIQPFIYTSQVDQGLFQHFQEGFTAGNTGSLSGFYGPQGRQLRLRSLDPEFLTELHHCGLDNFEMETSALYAFSKLLGHKAISLNCIIANRTTGRFLEDYKSRVDQMIDVSLQRWAQL
ncbi:MAG: nucleoside phosphorylase [Weeksellaceae bacterium]|nr:nucleoside phosphorylase [Weeksellaceae bacterium]